MMALGHRNHAIIGAILFNSFALLDCIDGHVARVKKEACSYGGWMDALGGYMAYSCVLLASGIAAEQLGSPAIFHHFNFIIISAVAAMANLLMRLQYQHYRSIQGENAAQTIKAHKRVGANLGVTGFLMPAVLLGVIFGKLDWVVVFYALFYVSAYIIVTLRLIKTIQKIQNSFLLKRESGSES